MKVIHRDIKPDNLLLVSVSTKTPVRAKISDFGTSKLVVNEENQELTKATGTPVFMAPEVLEGKQYSLPADVYSLGLTFWSIFTRRTPFDDVQNNITVYQKIQAGDLPPTPDNCKLKDLIEACTYLNQGCKSNKTFGKRSSTK